jgi:hypothetical protein
MNQFPILTDLDNGHALSLNAESFNGLKMQTYRKSAGWNVAAFQGKDAWILPVAATFVAGRDSIIRLLIPIQSPWRPDARACQNNATALISRSRHATYESVSPLLPTRIPVQQVAKAGLVVAGLQRQAALLRHEFALQNLSYLRNRQLNSEQWFRLANSIRGISDTYCHWGNYRSLSGHE